MDGVKSGRWTDGPNGNAALVIVRADGTIEEANQATLDLLGVTLEQLRAAPRNAFTAQPYADDEQEALRSDWEQAGSPDLGGETTIKRADGREVRVRYVVMAEPAGSYLIVLVPLDGSTSRSSTVYGLGGILTAWRGAERRLEAVEPGSDEWREVAAEVVTLRETYQARYRERRKGR